MARSPCIGICSTTYGDLVCRGCKRFAHEVVSWNGYDEGQKSTVWQRLRELQSGATLQLVDVVDLAALAREFRSESAGAPAGDLEPGLMIYEVLRRWARVGQPLGQQMTRLGLRLKHGLVPPRADALLRSIDQEFYLRSLAVYEHSFRRPPG